MFPLRHEGLALGCQEVDLPVERLRVDVGHLADPTEGCLVHQEGKDGPVFVRLLLTCGRGAHGECRVTGLAAVATRAGSGPPEGLVMRGSLGDRDVVIGTPGIRTGGVGPLAESSQQARPLFGDGLVALDGWLFVAKLAVEARDQPGAA